MRACRTPRRAISVTPEGSHVCANAQSVVEGEAVRVAAGADADAEEPQATGLIKHVPNTITLLRLAALPVFFWLYGKEAPRPAWRSAILMFAAAWSDVLDGWVARKYRATSELGRVLDPFVDRAFFVTVFAAYVRKGTLQWWAVAPVILRDVLMVVAAVFVFRSKAERPRVLPLGRHANFILAWAVGFFMLSIRVVAWPLYVVGATLYIISGVQYFLRFWRERERGSERAEQRRETAGEV